MKKKITWVTYDFFIDCDLNLIIELKKNYDITWFVLFPPSKMARFRKEDFLENINLTGVNIQFISIEFRLRYPQTYLFYIKLGLRINNSKYDILYFNGDAASLYNIPMIWLFDKRKLIYAIHEALCTTDDFNPRVEALINLSRKLTIPWIRNTLFFSNSQSHLFSIQYPKNQKFIIPLTLKDFGTSKLRKIENEVVFFNFGTIRQKKNIDLLIDAACNLYEQGYKGFKVAILGQCSNWEYYESKIKYPDLFICDIRLIKNSEIKDIFQKYHYLVLPYKIASQSGPLKIAYNYDIPVIVSDQPGFVEEVVEGVNGFIFKTGDLSSLESVLKNVLINHKNYNINREKMKAYTEENFSTKKIAVKYSEMFNEVICSK